jgi:hypothetical protein
MYKSGQKVELAKADPKFDWWISIPAFFLMIGLFILLDRISARNRQRIAAKEAQLLEKDNIYDPFLKRENL